MGEVWATTHQSYPILCLKREPGLFRSATFSHMGKLKYERISISKSKITSHQETIRLAGGGVARGFSKHGFSRPVCNHSSSE
jgi:hypothetical protein